MNGMCSSVRNVVDLLLLPIYFYYFYYSPPLSAGSLASVLSPLHTRSFHLTVLPPPAHRQAPHVVDFIQNTQFITVQVSTFLPTSGTRARPIVL
jgi:hypothetical protein